MCKAHFKQEDYLLIICVCIIYSFLLCYPLYFLGKDSRLKSWHPQLKPRCLTAPVAALNSWKCRLCLRQKASLSPDAAKI